MVSSAEKEFPGFLGVSMLADYEHGRYVSVSVWETRDDAMQGCRAIHKLIVEMIGDRYQWEPIVEYFKVYCPKSM